jgi:hypothetical protein
VKLPRRALLLAAGVLAAVACLAAVLLIEGSTGAPAATSRDDALAAIRRTALRVRSVEGGRADGCGPGIASAFRVSLADRAIPFPQLRPGAAMSVTGSRSAGDARRCVERRRRLLAGYGRSRETAPDVVFLPWPRGMRRRMARRFPGVRPPLRGEYWVLFSDGSLVLSAQASTRPWALQARADLRDVARLAGG